MEGIIGSVLDKAVAAAVIAVVLLLIYYAADIYLFVTGRDFGNVYIYNMYFTRNDFRSKSNALHTRVSGYRIPLREIYRNRFAFWLVMYGAAGVTRENPVLNFGRFDYQALAPIRGWIGRFTAPMELKRMAGMPFSEFRCQIALVYDRSDDRRNYVVKALLIRDEDLANFQRYLDLPPGVGDNFDLLKRIAEVYRQKTGSFMRFQIVAA